MEIFRIENLTFTYPARETPALTGVSLSVQRGEFVTLCGPSGCGKTTLLRLLKPAMAPHGVKIAAPTGGIFFASAPLDELSPREQAAQIGFVQQSPENQIVTDKVWHELAFGLESLGYKTAEIRLRVAEMASFFGIQNWFHKSVTELSGGQKQLLNLASVMAMQPEVLILDEPTAQLDPIAASEFLTTVSKLNRELGVTVILSEHRLEEVFPLSDRVVALENGRIIADGTPREAALILRGNGMFLAMPTATRVWNACGGDGDAPVTVREGMNWLENAGHGRYQIASADKPPRNDGAPAVEWKDVWFKYEKSAPDVIRGLNFTAYFGEFTAILGGNGAGKTTALSLAARLFAPTRGKVNVLGSCAALPQNPQALFVCKTVREDLLEISKDEKSLADVTALCRLQGLLDIHPYDLSGGEQQRAALAKVLLTRPQILLLDEPTKGLDAEFKQIFAGILKELAASGAAVVIVSHDIEFCAEHADRCALFFDGGVVSEGVPREFFSGNSFYTTAANRMARNIFPDAITVADIVAALGRGGNGGDNGGADKIPLLRRGARRAGWSLAAASHENSPQKTRLAMTDKKRSLVSLAMVLLAVPLTILAGMYFFGDRKYLIISLLIIFETMLPFALAFERRKPLARELVVIAVLCAIVVAGRAAFFMLPEFKPVTALIIISGAAFGGEAGFLIGAMSAFVSNIFFGQGPWTPWQMFAFGAIGFLAGVLFRKNLLPHSRVVLSVFGAVAALVIYGGIMNPASVLIFQPTPTKEMFALAYAQGLPLDLVHAAATVFFLAVISKPMLEKLDRIKRSIFV